MNAALIGQMTQPAANTDASEGTNPMARTGESGFPGLLDERIGQSAADVAKDDSNSARDPRDPKESELESGPFNLPSHAAVELKAAAVRPLGSTQVPQPAELRSAQPADLRLSLVAAPGAEAGDPRAPLTETDVVGRDVTEPTPQIGTTAATAIPRPPADGSLRDDRRSITQRGIDVDIRTQTEATRSRNPSAPLPVDSSALDTAQARAAVERFASLDRSDSETAASQIREAPVPPVTPSSAGTESIAAPASIAETASANGARGAPATSAPVEEVPVRVEWLVQRGGGTARFELDPPHLGRIELSVRLRGSDVEVVITARDPSAQAAVQAQRGQLAENLAARDLRLSQFEISDAVAAGTDDSHNSDPQGRASDRRGQTPDPWDDGFVRAVPGAGTGAPSSMQNHAPEPTIGSAASRIDLHI